MPPNPPTNLAGTTPANTQQVNLTWNRSTGNAPDSYVIYWKKASGSPIVIDPNDNSTYDGRIVTGQNANSYVHSGLDGATQYNYVIRAENSSGVVSTSEPSVNSYTITTNSFASAGPVTVDNDPHLVVYYDFNNNGTAGSELMNKSANSVGSYHLTAVGSEVIIAESQFTNNTAAYFDATEGYAYSDDVNQDNITELSNTGNFTIAAWIYPDQDMSNFSSVMSTGDQTNKDIAAFQISQISSSPNPNKIGMYAQNTDIKLEGPTILDNTWYHVVFTKEQNGVDNGTGTFYVNGVQADNETNFKTGFLKLKIGINRVSQNNWKGYIDEFKIYKRALDSTDVCDLFKNDGPLNDGATCP